MSLRGPKSDSLRSIPRIRTVNRAQIVRFTATYSHYAPPNIISYALDLWWLSGVLVVGLL